MIKVCHIITKLELGGAQQNTLHTVNTLNRHLFLPLLITGPEGMLVEEANRYTHVTTYYVPALVREIQPFTDLKAITAIARILKAEYQAAPHVPWIVHTHSSKAGIVGRWAAKLAGISCIIHSIHGFGFHPDQPPVTRWLYIFLEWVTARITTHFIAVSQANIQTGLRLGLFSASQVSLIRSGIDIPRFQTHIADSEAERHTHREHTLRELGIPVHKRIVGMIACFKPQKAPLDFIRVMRLVTETIPEAHAMLVGDGVLRPQIEALIAQQRLESGVSLLGWRTDIPALLPLCEVLVLTSRWEGLPRVCPQTMAAGVPIVATSVDGIPEAVQDGVNGFLLSPGDIRGMADKIIYLLTHPDIARDMGHQGQKLVDEFDIRRMVRQQEELYQSLLLTIDN